MPTSKTQTQTSSKKNFPCSDCQNLSTRISYEIVKAQWTGPHWLFPGPFLVVLCCVSLCYHVAENVSKSRFAVYSSKLNCRRWSTDLQLSVIFKISMRSWKERQENEWNGERARGQLIGSFFRQFCDGASKSVGCGCCSRAFLAAPAWETRKWGGFFKLLRFVNYNFRVLDYFCVK